MEDTQEVPLDQARSAAAASARPADSTPPPALRDGSQSWSQTGSQASGSLAAPPAAPARPVIEPAVWQGILKVAWLSIGLGVAIEILLAASAVALGTASGPKPFVADLAQKVSWSFLVCVGIAFGTAAMRARPPVMGLLGLLAAPLAFNVARFVHKGAAEALSVAAGGALEVSPFLLGLLKSVEYGILGWAVGWLGRRPGASLGHHLAVGLGVGLTFGVGIMALLLGKAGWTLPAVLARGINEVLFPVGCSLALYAANVVGRRAG